MRVDPLLLRQLGYEVQDEGDAVGELLSAICKRLTVTDAAAGPWRAAGAAAGVTDAWRTEFNGAAERLRQTGTSFVRAADDYVATDAWSASRIGQAQHRLTAAGRDTDRSAAPRSSDA